MRHLIRNILAVIFIAVISGSIAAGAHFYFAIEIRDAAIGAAIGFCVLLVLRNNLTLQRHFSGVERHFADTHQFERGIVGRVKHLETNVNSTQPDTAISNVAPLETSENIEDHDVSLAQIGKAASMLTEMAAPTSDNSNNLVSSSSAEQDEYKPDNIIALDSRLKRADKPPGSSDGGSAGNHTLMIKPSQLTKALDDGGAEIFLQPILELPSRKIRYFEALIRMRIDDNILTARQFLPGAKNSAQIARIDLISLELTFKVVRRLQRQNSDYPVFWNIASQSLTNKKAFGKILEQLRANQPLNQMLICEISHSTFKKLSKSQSGNLARIRDLGYELSIDKVTLGRSVNFSVEEIFKSGIFCVVKVPAMELMRISSDDFSNLADHVVPLATDRNITVIASEVENDTQTIAMIDADIFLAQGNGLMPARPLKKDLGVQ